MKAAREYKEQWEEANLIRLINLASNVNEKLNYLLKNALIAFNVSLYIFYRAAKGLYLIVKLLLLSEPALNRIERDESWIFRQIK